WCSFAAAVKGDEKARRGYAFMYGNAGNWDVIRECHEKSMREAMSKILSEREAGRAAREANGDAEARGQRTPPHSKADPGLNVPRKFVIELKRGDASVVERIIGLLSEGPMKPSALRRAVGIKSRIHFNRYYLVPMLEKGLVVRTDPDHPNSPQQAYKLV
ncbi:MAG: Fic family protein, partial [Kiritimatiellia bacterium]